MKNALAPKSLFAAAPAIAVCMQDGSVPRIAVKAEPTRDYGVGLAHVHLKCVSYTTKPPTSHHMVWLHRSGPVATAVRVAGRRYDCTPDLGSTFVYPAESDATCEASGPGEGLNIRVSAECMSLAVSQLTGRGGSLVPRISCRDDALFAFGRILEAEAAAHHPNGKLYWSSVADALIRHLSTHHLIATSMSPRGAFGRDALQRLKEYIRDHLAEPLDLACLAAVIGCDRFHFAHRFRATVGMSPHRYVMRLRLDYARERITNCRLSLAQIASEAGFADQSHLCRWSRRIYDQRPNDLRP